MLNKSLSGHLASWFDSHAKAPAISEDNDRRIEWTRVLPYVFLHLACGFVFMVGFSWVAFALFIVSYAIRVFGITGGYHRYFAHRAYRAGRITQFVLAVLGASATQRGPLWWAAHHRHHHKFSDEPEDPHSPVAHPFWWSHMGWFMARGNFRTRSELIKDFAGFPELVFLDRFDSLVPALYGALMFAIGYVIDGIWPQSGTTGAQTLVWGYVLATIAMHHVTFAINSLTHASRIGKRRYLTQDKSRNVWWLALFTFGESWHNNHHHFAASARLGFFWWEVDIGFYVIRTLAACGLAWDLKRAPQRYLFPQTDN